MKTKAKALPPSLKRTHVERLLYAICNHGHGAESCIEGARFDAGVDRAISIIFDGILNPEYEHGLLTAMKLYFECLAQPNPVAYAEEQIKLGLTGKRANG